MDRYLEIVQIVDGRLFDEECYERANVPESAKDCAPGFYAVLRPSGAASGSFDCGVTFVGPFASARLAQCVSKGGPHD
jgi:hypothetical protein